MTISGIIHGDTIKLDRPSGLPDGQRVQVDLNPQLRHLTSAELDVLRERMARTFGSLKGEAQDVDEFTGQVRRERDAWIGRGDLE